MALATLSVDLVAKMAKFEADLGKASRAAEANSKRMALAFDFVKGAIVGMAGALSVGVFANSVREVATYADEIGKMAQRVGIGTEALSGLTYAAKLSDVSNETLSTGLKKLSGVMQEAAGGVERQKRVLKELGVTELQDVNKAFLQLADRFSEMEEGAGKGAAAAEVFGMRAGPELLTLLNQGAAGINAATAEAERFGIIVTRDAVVAAERFNDNLERLATLAQGARVSLLSNLVDGLGRATQAYLDAAAAGSKFQGVIAGIRTFLTGDDRYKNDKTLVEQTDKLLSLEKEISTLRSSGSALDAALATRKEAQLKTLQREIQTTLAYRKVLEAEDTRPKATGKVNASIFNSTIPKPPKLKRFDAQGKELDLTNKALARYLEQLDSTIQRTQELTAVEEARIFLSKQQGVSDKDAEQVLSLARRIDTEKALKEATQDRIDSELDAMRRVDEANEQYQSRLKSLTDSAATNVFKRQADDLQFLIDALAKGDIALQVYNESVDNLFNVTEEKMEKTKSLAEELGLTFTSAFEDAIVGGKGFSDVLKGLEKDIIRLVTRKAVTEPLGNFITGAIGGSGGGSGGGIGGFFSKLFSGLSFDGGGSTGNGPRSGGLDGKGGFMAMLHPKETVTDHTKGGGRNVIVTINQSFAPGTSRQTTMQAAVDARRQLEFAGRSM